MHQIGDLHEGNDGSGFGDMLVMNLARSSRSGPTHVRFPAAKQKRARLRCHCFGAGPTVSPRASFASSRAGRSLRDAWCGDCLVVALTSRDRGAAVARAVAVAHETALRLIERPKFRPNGEIPAWSCAGSLPSGPVARTVQVLWALAQQASQLPRRAMPAEITPEVLSNPSARGAHDPEFVSYH